MWLHFGGTLTLKSDDGRGAGAAASRPWYMYTPGQDDLYMWARITGGGLTVRVGKNCAIARC